MNPAPSNQKQIVLEVEGYVRGRQFLNKKIKRVRIDDGSYRAAKDNDFHGALHWLMQAGYELAEKAGPGHTMGTETVTYIYRKPIEQKSKGA